MVDNSQIKPAQQKRLKKCARGVIGKNKTEQNKTKQNRTKVESAFYYPGPIFNMFRKILAQVIAHRKITYFT